MRKYLGHGLVELLSTDSLVVVAVNLCHDLLPYLLVIFFQGVPTEPTVENGAKLLLANVAIAVSVENFKGYSQVLLIEQLLPVDCRSYELAVVNLAILVRVELRYQITPVLGP